MQDNKRPFLDFIDRTKPYMDGLWDDEQGWYAEPDHDTGIPVAVTYANAHMIATVAMLAGHGLADEEDIARIRRILETHWTVEPTYIGSTWRHALGDPKRDYHHANDQICAEATYFAWNYRDALGLTPELGDVLRTLLTEDNKMGDYDYHTVQYPQEAGYVDNQSASRWLLNRLQYAYWAGRDDLADGIRACLRDFIGAMDKPPGPGLYPDFGWMYRKENGWGSFEYNAMCFGGNIYYPEFSDIFSLSEEEQARMRAWQRKILGTWQRNGLPNWDTQYDCYRLYNGQYWAWLFQGLMAIARPGALNMGSEDHHYARWIFDRALETFSRMDTWRLRSVDEHDPEDGVPPRVLFPIDGWYEDPLDMWPWRKGKAWPEVNSKSAFAASFLRHAAHAIELGIHEVEPREPETLWRWDWHNRSVYVSTPVYDAASLPRAGTYTMWERPHTVGNQHWGVSRIAAPDGQILTSLGSREEHGLESFCFQVLDEHDTIRDEPEVQEVARDGVPLSFEPYDTSEIPLGFDKEINERCTRQGPSYRCEVETTFRHDAIVCTYRAERTGPAKSGSVVLSIPARQHVLIECIDKHGDQTDIWDGETVTPVSDPLAARCFRMRWPEWNAELVLTPQDGALGENAHVTALGYRPYSSPRQLDQDRSLLIYLAKDELVESVSITFEIALVTRDDMDD